MRKWPHVDVAHTTNKQAGTHTVGLTSRFPCGHVINGSAKANTAKAAMGDAMRRITGQSKWHLTQCTYKILEGGASALATAQTDLRTPKGIT